MPTRSECITSVQPVFFTPDLPIIIAISNFANRTYLASLKILLGILFMGLMFQLFSVVILTRRSMTNLGIRKKLLLLVIAAVFLSTVSFIKYLIEFLDDFICGFHYSYIMHVFEIANTIIFTISHEVIIRCVLYITLTRVNIVIKTRYSKKYCISRKLIIWFIVISMFLMFVNQALLFVGREIEEITDPIEYSLILEGFEETNCTLSQNVHLYRLHIKLIDCQMKKPRAIVTTFIGEIIPCAILLASTIFLAMEVRRIANNNSSSKNKRRTSQNSRSLLIFLILFFLSEIPLAIIYGIGMISPADFAAIDVMYVQEDCFIFLNLNIGIFVYCTMSSLYRETVKGIFGLGDRENVIEVRGNKQSRTTNGK